MYPAISDIINDVFGTNIHLPIQTYGFFVAMAYLTGTWVLKREMKVREKQGLLLSTKKKILVGAPASVKELVILGILSLLIGYKFSGMIIEYRLFSEDPQGYLMSLKGSYWGGAVVAAAFVLYRWYTKKKKKLDKPIWEEVDVYPHDQAGTILIVAAIFGILGAKIFHNLENFDALVADPVGEIFSFMGLTFYGGLIVGSAAVIIYARRQKIAVLPLIDSAAPAIALAYGVGRLGCHMSGDGCWGVANLHPKPGWLTWLPDWLWAYKYPHNVVHDGIPIDHCTGEYCTILKDPVYPTSLYDFIFMAIVCVVLILIRNKVKVPGHLFSILLIIIGVQRFFIEKIRVNNTYHIGSLHITQAEIISIVMVLLGALGIWYFRRRHLRSKINKL